MAYCSSADDGGARAVGDVGDESREPMMKHRHDRNDDDDDGDDVNGCVDSDADVGRKRAAKTFRDDDVDGDADDDDKPFDLDDLLPAIGQFGRYQKLLLWLICLPACIPCGFCAFNQLFMADTPHDFWCRVPALAALNLSETQQRDWAIPVDELTGRLSQCKRYAIDWEALVNETLDSTDADSAQLPGWLPDVLRNRSLPVETCSQGWVYNRSEVSSSIVIDYDLVCDRDIYPTIGLAALNTGGPVGVYMFGVLNDRLGRRISFFACLATLLTGSFLTVLSPDFWSWAGSRVIVGLTLPAVYQIPFIIALELVGPDYRSFVTTLTCTFYTGGIMMLAGVCYFIRDWQLMGLVTSVPFLAYFGYMFVLPESPRWLLARGRLEEALKVLEVMARVNGHQLPASFRNELEQRVRVAKARKVQRQAKTFGALDLCRTPNMRLKTILITLNWFASETVYLGLSYYGPTLGTDQYLSFFLSSVVELPSYLFCFALMDRWGRRWPLCLSMMLSGISCICTVVVPEDDVTRTLLLFLLSKFLISASFLIIYPFAGEIYPTQVRGVGIGTSSYIGGIGLMIIPFVTYLGRENLRTPLVVMGCLSVLGGFCGLRLPETLHYRLPQTLEEGEEFGKDWKFADCLRCIPLKPTAERSGSYEHLDGDVRADAKTQAAQRTANQFELDESAVDGLLDPARRQATERTPLELERTRRQSMRRLVRQKSTVDTQKSEDGTMQLTYWI